MSHCWAEDFVLRPEAPAGLKARALATELLPQGPWPQGCCHSSVRVLLYKRVSTQIFTPTLPCFLHTESLPMGGVSSWFHSDFTAAAWRS